MRKITTLIFAALLFAAPAFSAPASAPAEPPYITPDQIDITHLLADPPKPGTPEQQRDIVGVLAAQANASDAERARALADGDISIFRFADVLGPKFHKGKLPLTEHFFARALVTTRPFVVAGKAHWSHDRPFVMDPIVRSPDDMVKGVCADSGPGSPPSTLCPHGVTYSYPSGHSTFGTMVAILLGEMVPEKRAALLVRGRQYGESRIINGVHFPTDVEAGRIQATVFVALMMQNPQFRADLAAARAELRKELDLPLAP